MLFPSGRFPYFPPRGDLRCRLRRRGFQADAVDREDLVAVLFAGCGRGVGEAHFRERRCGRVAVAVFLEDGPADHTTRWLVREARQFHTVAFGWIKPPDAALEVGFGDSRSVRGPRASHPLARVAVWDRSHCRLLAYSAQAWATAFIRQPDSAVLGSPVNCAAGAGGAVSSPRQRRRAKSALGRHVVSASDFPPGRAGAR